MNKRPLIFVGSRNKMSLLMTGAESAGHEILGIMDQRYLTEGYFQGEPILGDERLAGGEFNGIAVKLKVPNPSDFGSSDLKKYLNSRLEYFKVPKFVYLVDEIPRTPSGKKNRKAVQ